MKRQLAIGFNNQISIVVLLMEICVVYKFIFEGQNCMQCLWIRNCYKLMNQNKQKIDYPLLSNGYNGYYNNNGIWIILMDIIIQ